MESVTQYIILKILLLIILVISGYGISKGNKRYFWFYALLSIVSYTVIQGLRYDRGVDYKHYMRAYIDPQVVDRDREWFFAFINKVLSEWLGLPYYGAFLFYSFLLILAVVLVLKKYRKIALYALPIFLLTTIDQSENLIRQFLAVPFVYLSFLYLMKDKWKICLVYFFLAFSIHSSCVILLPFLLLLYYIKLPIFSSIWLLVAYLAIALFWKIDYWGGFVDIVGSLSNEQFSVYTENAKRWFTAEGSLSALQGREGASLISIIRRVLMNSIIIYFGYEIIKKYPKFQLPFFLYYISVIILTMAFDIELIVRVGRWFYIFEMFVAGFVLVYTPRKNGFVKCTLLFVCVNYLYSYVADVVRVIPENSLFVWNLPTF